MGWRGQGRILGHFEDMVVIQFKGMFLGQGDSGGNEKWMDMGSRINKTWVVRTWTAHFIGIQKIVMYWDCPGAACIP